MVNIGPLHFASCEAEATLKQTPGRHRMPKGFGWHMSAVYMGGSVCLEWHKAPPVREREMLMQYNNLLIWQHWRQLQ